MTTSRRAVITSVDAETNGLHGRPFAVGATRDDGSGIAEVFLARCPIDGPLDPWVAANVLPGLEDLPVTHKTYLDLLADFAAWYDLNRPSNAITIAHVAWPVEARLFTDMVSLLGRDPFSGPFPLHDVASMLLAVCYHNPESVDEYITDHGLIVGDAFDGFGAHHPLYDARAAAVAARHLLSGGPS